MIPATERISSLVCAASLKFGVSERQRPIPPLAKPIRILIAAKYALMRRGLRVIFEQLCLTLTSLRMAVCYGARSCPLLLTFRALIAVASRVFICYYAPLHGCFCDLSLRSYQFP